MLNETYRGMLAHKSVIRETFMYGKQRAAQIGYENVFDYSLGNPSVPCPEQFTVAMQELLAQEDPVALHGYCPSQGDPEFRTAVAAHLNRTFGLPYAQKDIFPTTGAAGAIAHALRAVTRPGDEVLTFAPYFPEYGPYVEGTGAHLRVVPPQAPAFQPNLEAFEQMLTEKVTCVLINTPNNPTGVVYSADTLTRLAEILNQGLVDYVAMDVKNAPARYAETVGIPGFNPAPVEESIRLLRKSTVDYEFRTTLVRELHRPEDLDAIRRVYENGVLQVTGIYSHLCVADTDEEEHVDFSRWQAETFKSVVESLQARGVELGTVHLLSSYAAVNYPEYAYDYARLGILMFGVKSSAADYLREDLQPMPVMTLKARITSVREIGPGETVSYGRIFRAERPTKVASVSIGYADGIPRCLSGGKLRAIVRGQYAQGIGRICMDQLMLDVTGIEDVRVGDEAVFIGRQGDCVIYAEELAENAGTITNELFSRLGARVEGRCFRQEA